MKSNFKNKCDFCKYKTASGCMARPDSSYCREAIDELYRYIEQQKLKNKRRR